VTAVLPRARVAQGAAALGATQVGRFVTRVTERAELGAPLGAVAVLVVVVVATAHVVALVVVPVVHHIILPVR
jgi:hypothetical protein